MTATRSKTRTDGEVHVLDFALGDNGCCALTALVKDFRFHIAASPENFGSTDAGHDVGSQYQSLIGAVEAQAKGNSDDATDSNSTYKSNGLSVQRHSAIYNADLNGDSDSGVDVGEGSDHLDGQKSELAAGCTDEEDAKKDLQDWMLSPFQEIFESLPLESEGTDLQSLHEWYSGPTYFYKLSGQDGALRFVQLEAQDELEEKIRNLCPRIPLRKYIEALGFPWINANDVLVLTASNESGSYRPSRVQAGEEIYHFKAVDQAQPQTTGRELKLLREIERKGLHKKMRVPVVAGIVGMPDNNSKIIGFLQTSIENPTSLTLMFDSDVVEEKRGKWATETERVVKLLHDNDIVWGDAKADNFMVDRHGDLWIIDFGGSYTEGWVDPELMETEEGDDMGVEKIVNALEDPEANTYDPAVVSEAEEKSQISSTKRAKETEMNCQEESSERSSPPKRRKIS